MIQAYLQLGKEIPQGGGVLLEQIPVETQSVS
jgi:hypothetical protein